MLLLWALPIGILIGYLRGGHLSHLANLELRQAWLVLTALIIQLLIFPLRSGAQPLIPVGTVYFHLASYALLAVFVVLNRRVWGLLAMGVGMLLNLAVITFNGGYMPTQPGLLEATGRSSEAQQLRTNITYANNICMDSQHYRCQKPDTPTPLWFLGDVFYVPAGVPFANVFSLGDLLLAVGLIWLLQAKMRP